MRNILITFRNYLLHTAMYKRITSEKPTVTWLKLSLTIYILFPILISCLLLAMLIKINYKLSVNSQFSLRWTPLESAL